jgi:hypothetical protein
VNLTQPPRGTLLVSWVQPLPVPLVSWVQPLPQPVVSLARPLQLLRVMRRRH